VHLIDALIVGTMAVGVAYLVAVVALKAGPTVLGLGSDVWHSLTQPFTVTFSELDRGKRLQLLDAEIGRAMGLADAWGSQERSEIVEAAVAAQQLSLLNQHLRKTARQCLSAHWAVAEGIGSPHMGNAARHPWCNGLRQKVIDTSDLLAQRIEEYPLVSDSPELMRLHLGIRWIGPTCATCIYRTSLVADAPRVCPTVKALGRGPNAERDCEGGRDAEIVEDVRND
jgi:hypothetical protein